MSIKCSKCYYNNLSSSAYCQECGEKLHKEDSSKKNSDSKSLHEEIEEVSDIIFKPKKSGLSIKNIIVGLFVIGVVGFLGLLVLAFVFSDDGYDTTDYDYDTATSDNTVFPIYQLSLEDVDSEWIGQTFYLTGVLKNSHNLPASDVTIRIDFYRDQTQTKLFDTRFVTVAGASANGAYSFREPVYIQIPSQETFWYVAQIDNADYLQ